MIEPRSREAEGEKGLLSLSDDCGAIATATAAAALIAAVPAATLSSLADRYRCHAGDEAQRLHRRRQTTLYRADGISQGRPRSPGTPKSKRDLDTAATPTRTCLSVEEGTRSDIP